MDARIKTGSASSSLAADAADRAAGDVPGLLPDIPQIHVNEDVDLVIIERLSEAGFRLVVVPPAASDTALPCVIVWGDPARALLAARVKGQPLAQALDTWSARGRVLLDIHASGGCVLIDQHALAEDGAGWNTLRSAPGLQDLPEPACPGADALRGRTIQLMLVHIAVMQSSEARQTLERLQSASGAAPTPSAGSLLEQAAHGISALHAIETEMAALRVQIAQAQATASASEALYRKSMAEAEQMLAQALRDLREEAATRQALEMRRSEWLAARLREALSSIRWRIAKARRRFAGQMRPGPMAGTGTDQHDDPR